MDFTKGVHRIIIDTKKELTADTVTVLYAKDDGEWETAGTSEGVLKTNTITDLLANILQNRVFNCSSTLCGSSRVIYSSIDRAAIYLPNQDGTEGRFALAFGNGSDTKNIYDAEIAADVLVTVGYLSGSGYIDGQSFADFNNNHYSGVYATDNRSGTRNTSTYSVLQYPLLMTIDVQDDFYSIGISNYMDISTVNAAKIAYIETSIFIGKTDKDNNYVLYMTGYSGSVTGDNIHKPQYIVALTDSNELLYNGFLYVEQPYNEVIGFGKLNKLSVFGNDLGWYYGSRQYKSLQGNYGVNPSNSELRSLFINTYNFNRFVDNAVTINNKSFDAYVGKTYYGVMLFREHE